MQQHWVMGSRQPVSSRLASGHEWEKRRIKLLGCTFLLHSQQSTGWRQQWCLQIPSTTKANPVSLLGHSPLFPQPLEFSNLQSVSNGTYYLFWVLPGLLRWLSGKESTCQCRRCGLDPWVRKIPREGNSHPLQYSCLGNSTDRGAWWATVHWVAHESDMT